MRSKGKLALAVLAMTLVTVAGSLSWYLLRQDSKCSPTMAYSLNIAPAGKSPHSELVVISGCGKQRRVFTPPAADDFYGGVLTPDGKSVLFSATLSNEVTPDPTDPDFPSMAPSEVYTGSLATGEISRITHFKGSASPDAVSPDGKTMMIDWFPFNSTDPMQKGLYVMPVSGGGKPLQVGGPDSGGQWSNDGKYLAIGFSHMGSSTVTVLSIKTWKDSDLPSRELGAPDNTFLGSVAFTPDSKYLLIDYSPNWPAVPMQVFARNLASGVMKQVTHIPHGVSGARMANDWTLYYQSDLGGNTNGDASIYRYSFQTQKTVLVVSGRSDDVEGFSVAHTGSIGKRPSVFNW